MSTQIIAVGVSPRLRDALNAYNEGMFSVTSGHIEDLNAAAIRTANERQTVILLDTSSGKVLDAPRDIRKLGFLGPVVGITTMPRDSVEDEHADAERLFLMCGGDRLVRTPFTVRLVAFVIESLLRRGSCGEREVRVEQIPQEKNELVFGGGRMKMRKDTHGFTVDGHAVHLTAKEFKILFHMGSRPGVLFSRQQLMNAAKIDSDAYERNVDSHLKRVREKIQEVAPTAISCFVTIYGRGYSVQS